MIKKFTSAEIQNIAEASNYIKTNQHTDSLYILVCMIGPLVIGKIMNRSLSAVWRRVSNPDKFSYGDMKALSKATDISLSEFHEIIARQCKHNWKEKNNSRPVGKEKYMADMISKRNTIIK